jgi:hypothetical protein
MRIAPISFFLDSVFFAPYTILFLALFTLQRDSLALRGEILRPPENSVPQTIVYRYQEIGDILCGNHRKTVMFLSKYSLDRNNIIASLFRTQYTLDFLVAIYYGLRNTIFGGVLGSRLSFVEHSLGIVSAPSRTQIFVLNFLCKDLAFQAFASLVLPAMQGDENI